MSKEKSFAMIWRPWFGRIQLQVAHRLMCNGWKGTLYIQRPEFIPGLASLGPIDRFERIVPFQILYDTSLSPVLDEDREIGRARNLEVRLSLTYGDLMLSDRHLGRGFALGGPKFPTSGASRASLGQAYNAISSQLEFWLKELSMIRASLVLDADIFAEKVAFSLGANVRNLAASRHDDYFYYAHDAIMRTPMLQHFYDGVEDQENVHKNVVQAKEMVDYYKTVLKQAQITYVLKSTVRRILQRLYGKIKRRSNAAGYDLWSEIAYTWRHRSNIIRMMSKPTVSFESLSGRKIVYFPLASEPEVTLQVLSREYFYQLETIAALERVLPADVVLVVKEHFPACGARSTQFYDQLFAFKRLRVIDIRTPGLEVIRRSDVIVTIAGSAGFEAAALGKPTVLLGRNNLCDFLPHVHVVKDIASIGDAMNNALEGRLAGEGAKASGQRFIRAVEAMSFRATQFAAHDRTQAINDQVGDAAFACLSRSLDFRGA